jgi:hypothetical protein
MFDATFGYDKLMTTGVAVEDPAQGDGATGEGNQDQEPSDAGATASSALAAADVGGSSCDYHIHSRSFRATYPDDGSDQYHTARLNELNATFWDMDGAVFAEKPETFHEHRCFEATVAGITWVLFFHDAREGPLYHGWWVTQKLGELFTGRKFADLKTGSSKVLLFSPDTPDEPDGAQNWYARSPHSAEILSITHLSMPLPFLSSSKFARIPASLYSILFYSILFFFSFFFELR